MKSTKSLSLYIKILLTLTLSNGEKAMRIALFSTCIVDGMYPKVAKATVDILQRLGHEVVYPQGQTCCSQMHVNSGYFADALPIVKNHVESFEQWDFDLAVAPSGSCVASLGHQQPMIARRAGDEDLAARAEILSLIHI